MHIGTIYHPDKMHIMQTLLGYYLRQRERYLGKR